MCYLVAKDRDAHGCFALKTTHGKHLVELKRELNRAGVSESCKKTLSVRNCRVRHKLLWSQSTHGIFCVGAGPIKMVCGYGINWISKIKILVRQAKGVSYTDAVDVLSHYTRVILLDFARYLNYYTRKKVTYEYNNL